ncbi:MAG: hypothetical protein IJ802_02210, partial [Kiritimatiellae bacterium]|nr:hypothetical protein [Kiritimatiellia bacterium]
MRRSVFFICAICAGLLNGATEFTPRSVVSADRLVSVSAADGPGDEIGFRTPLLRFAGDTAAALKQTFSLTVPRRSIPAIAIHCGNGLTEDSRISKDDSVEMSVKYIQGERQTKIYLPAPGWTDKGKLRHAIAKAFFGVWGEVPDWFVEGALRATDNDTLLADLQLVQEDWRAGFMPSLLALLDNPLAAGNAEATMLVHWMRETKTIARTLDALAAGEKWNTAEIAQDLTGQNLPYAQDCALDERMVKLRRSVLQPGRATRQDLNVFSSYLKLYPAVFDLHFAGGKGAVDFREAIDIAQDDMTVRLAAILKMRDLPVRAIGRGDALAETSAAYSEFL